MLQKLSVVACAYISCAYSVAIPEDFSKKASVEWDLVIKDTNNLADNDPRAGAHDCEEQAVILMEIIKLNKNFKDLDPKVQRYITLRYLFSPKYKHVLDSMNPDDVKKLREEITNYVNEEILKIAAEILPKKFLEDDAFKKTAVSETYDLKRMSTTTGCLMVFEYAKKYNLPVLIRMQEKNLENSSVNDYVIPYIYDKSKKSFVYSESINKKQPILVIQMFCVKTKENKTYTIDNNINKENFSKSLIIKYEQSLDLLNLWKRISSKKEPLSKILKETDPTNLILLIAADDDRRKGRDVSKSKIIGPFGSIIDIAQPHPNVNEENLCYIKHIYVSSISRESSKR